MVGESTIVAKVGFSLAAAAEGIGGFLRRVVARRDQPVARSREHEARFGSRESKFACERKPVARDGSKKRKPRKCARRVLYSNNSSNLFPPLVRGGGIDMR